MKKVAIAFLLLISYQLPLVAQDITLKPSKLESLLCKQWKIAFAQMGDMKIEQIPEAIDFDLRFETDGTYEVIGLNEDENTGTWFYDEKEKTVELNASGDVTFKIKSISKEDLVINLNLGEDAPPGMSNLKLHFQPAKGL